MFNLQNSNKSTNQHCGESSGKGSSKGSGFSGFLVGLIKVLTGFILKVNRIQTRPNIQVPELSNLLLEQWLRPDGMMSRYARHAARKCPNFSPNLFGMEGPVSSFVSGSEGLVYHFLPKV